MGDGHIGRRRLLIGGLVVAGGAVGTGVLGLDAAWALDTPSIIGCGDWGARKARSTIKVYRRRPVRILVHHTATANVADTSRAAGVAIARDVQRFHMDVRGWIDTGQHFTISRGGYVLEGRHRSLEMLRGGTRQVEGAHCTGQNILSIGIENQGTYTATAPPSAQWKRLRQLCAHICRQYGIAPTEIFGHRDFKDTACPGDAFYRKLPTLRTEVAGLLDEDVDPAEVTPDSWPLLRVADQGPDVLAAQHLLRAAGETDVEPDGQFDRRTADAVRRFQRAHGTEEVNGMIGGESWPLLVAPPGPVSGRETRRALQALTDSSGSDSPRAPDLADWRRLLVRRGTAGG